MAVFRYESHVGVPLDDVWNFHVRTDGLVAVTPGWMRLRVERVAGPDGETGSDVLAAGSEVTLSVRPFGVGPRRRWTARVVQCERTHDRGVVVDRMDEGPFACWEHTHRFVAEDGGTRVRDIVEWRLPGGPAGELAARLGVVGLALLFRSRHRRTRTLLDG